MWLLQTSADKLKTWLGFQPGPGEYDIVKQCAKFDFRWSFQSVPEEYQLAGKSSELDFGCTLQPEHGTCNIARWSSGSDSWPTLRI